MTHIDKDITKIYFLDVQSLDFELLETIYNIKKQIEMCFALSSKLMGINKDYPTSKEIRMLLTNKHQENLNAQR